MRLLILLCSSLVLGLCIFWGVFFISSCQNGQALDEFPVVEDDTSTLIDVRDSDKIQVRIPGPDPFVFYRPTVVANPGDDINKIVRDGALSGRLFVLGIVGKHSQSLRLCKKYGAYPQNGDELVIQVVGMTPDAEIRGIHFYGEEGHVKSATFHNLRVSTSYGARSPIFDIAKSERLVFNNITLLPDPDHMNAYGGAGMKWGFDLGDGSDYLHINKCKRGSYRGKKVRFEEHWAYLKSTGELFITNNDISGGNRTGFQVRTPGNKEAPHGKMVISGNYAEDYGWDWDFNNGGSCITVWESLNFPVFIINNRITNAKYGCVAIAHQPPGEKIHGDSRQHLLPSGRAHSRVFFHGNTFTNEDGNRSCVSINSSENVQILSGEFKGSGHGDIIIDSETAWKWGSFPCINVLIDGDLQEVLNIQHWNGETYVKW